MGPQYIDPGFARQSTADRRDAAKRNGGAGFSSERFQLKPLLRCGHSRGWVYGAMLGSVFAPATSIGRRWVPAS
jgi:hypothetical protein